MRLCGDVCLVEARLRKAQKIRGRKQRLVCAWRLMIFDFQNLVSFVALTKDANQSLEILRICFSPLCTLQSCTLI
jgi:hypothetical protein